MRISDMYSAVLSALCFVVALVSAMLVASDAAVAGLAVSWGGTLALLLAWLATRRGRQAQAPIRFRARD